MSQISIERILIEYATVTLQLMLAKERIAELEKSLAKESSQSEKQT